MTVGLLSFAYSASPSTITAAAKSLIGGFDVQGFSYAFQNFAKVMGNQGGAIPFQSSMNADGYPVVDLSVGGTVAWGSALTLNSSLVGSGVTWVLSWSGKGGVGITPSDATGITVKSVSTNTGLTTNTTYPGTAGPAGTNGYMEFTFTGATISVNIFFSQFISYGTPGGGNAMSNLQLYRKTDQNVAQTGPKGTFTSEFKNLLLGVNPRVLRMMDWGHTNSSNVSHYIYRAASTALSYLNDRWDSTLWAGVTTGTGTAYTCANPSGSPGSGAPINGETIQVQFHAANTSTAPTLTVTGRTGTIPITFNNASALNVGTITTNCAATLVYDSLLNLWLGDFSSGPAANNNVSGGLLTGVPLEEQVKLCNELGTDFWYNFPFHITDASVSSTTAYVRDNLGTSQKAYFEYTNEHWNFGFVQFGLCKLRGAAFGFSSASGRQEHGYYGYRVKQIMDLVTAAWSPRSTSTLRRVMAIGEQASDPTGTQLYQFNGSDLASVANGGAGNAAWVAAGNANYTQGSPTFSRPIDVCDSVSYATYFSGAVLNNGGSYDTTELSVADRTAFTNAVDANDLSWADNQFRKGTRQTVTCSLPSAIASNTITVTNNFVNTGGDNGDVVIFSSSGTMPTGLTAATPYRVNSRTGTTFKVETLAAPGTPLTISGGTGTLTIGALGGETLLWHSAISYPAWETVVASYDGARPGGFSSLKVDCYEGGLQATAPTSGQCSAMSISGTYVTSAATYLANYKNNALAAQLVVDNLTQAAAGGLHSNLAAWFALQGPQGPWSLMPGDTFSTPYQLYYGNKTYNT